MEKSQQIWKYIKYALQVIVGVFFVSSSILKAITVDEFDMYIYSFGLFDYVFSTLIARLLITFEFVFGLLFILNIYYKRVWFVIFSTTILFTLFLIYVQIFRNDENCHCMGEIVKLDPLHSILKNIAIVLVMFFIRKSDGKEWKIQKWLALGITVLSFVLVFAIVPPSGFYNFLYSGRRDINVEMFSSTITDTTYNRKIVNIKIIEENNTCSYEEENTPLILDNEPYLMGFIHSGCKYCKLSMKKIRLMIDQNEINPKRVILFIWGDYEHMSEFIYETETYDFEYRIVEVNIAVDIAYGKFPTFFYYKDNEVKDVFEFNTINEQKIIEYLK